VQKNRVSKNQESKHENMFLETHIQVSDIPEDGLFLNFTELAGLISEVDDYCTISHASGRLEIHRSDAEIHISGRVKSKVKLACDRCLQAFSTEVEASFFYLLKPTSEFYQDLESDHELSGDEVEVYWYEDGEIRAEELFREQILLQLPMRILCREDCRGLCPGCGADLNLEECRCKEVHATSPFAVLSRLKTV